MVDLDELKQYKQLDPSGMLAQLYGLPQQCLNAWDKAENFDLPREYRIIDKVVILGMGGSAIGSDLVRTLASYEENLIVFVNREYELPAFVNEKTHL